MKGDYSRRTFDERKHYSAVLQDQGRMLSEADLEEEHRILAYRIEREAADLIGGCGGPLGTAGFAISEDGAGGLSIGGGQNYRYYVDGILVENEADATAFDKQPDRRDVEALSKLKTGRYFAYLDVWRRLITAIDDPTIREVALGGPTTSGRERTIWQVRLVQAEATAHCLSALPALEKTDGLLAAQATPGDDTDDPCIVSPTAGFKGLENQFYRVEIHDGGDAYNLTTDPGSAAITTFSAEGRTEITVGGGAWAEGDRVEIYRSGVNVDPLPADLFVITNVDATGVTLTLNRPHPPIGPTDTPRLRKAAATFVWSRDNGSAVAAIDGVNGTDVTVLDLGPDDVRGFQVGQWVEITDDGRELEGKPGALAWVQEILVAQRIVRLTAAPDAPWLDKARHPKLRRWDGAGAVRFNNPAPGKDWVALEDGIQIRFTAGHYRNGDYWHFPARAITLDPASGNIDWPQEAGGPKLLPPHGVIHHTCPLAIVDLIDTANDGTPDKVSVVADCRNLFPPVTELTTLHYVGGDGQEGTPHPNQPDGPVALADPLKVRVANGTHPVIGAQVLFTIVDAGSGQLLTPQPAATTGPDGIAETVWQLDGKTQPQRVDAQLLDVAGNPVDGQVVHFHANLSRASDVSYDPSGCPDLAGKITVQDAIDALCQRESRGGGCCCVVVGPGGDYERIDEAVVAEVFEEGKGDVCICLLPGTHKLPQWELMNQEQFGINVKIAGCGPNTHIDTESVVRLGGFWSLTISDVDIAIRGDGFFRFDQIREVRLESIRLSGFRPEAALVEIHNATNVYVGNSVFEAQRGPSDDVIEVLKFDVFPELAELFAVADWRDFVGFSREVAVRLAALPQDVREELWRDILRRVNNQHLDPLSMEVENACRRFAFALVQEDRDPFALIDHLIAIREEAIRSEPGMALELSWTIEGAPNPDVSAPFISLRNPGRTRAGEIVVENNVIIGGLSLYGPGQDPWPTTPISQALSRLERILDPPGNQTGSVLFNGYLGVAHLRNNHLTRVFVAQELAQAIIELPQTGNEVMLETVFKSLHVTDNVIDGTPNVFVAEHVALTSNNFTLDAVRNLELGDDVGQRLETVVVIGDTGTYTGNHGRGTVPLIQTALRDVTRERAAAANLELEVV